MESAARHYGCARCRYADKGCSRCRNPAFRPRARPPSALQNNGVDAVSADAVRQLHSAGKKRPIQLAKAQRARNQVPAHGGTGKQCTKRVHAETGRPTSCVHGLTDPSSLKEHPAAQATIAEGCFSPALSKHDNQNHLDMRSACADLGAAHLVHVEMHDDAPCGACTRHRHASMPCMSKLKKPCSRDSPKAVGQQAAPPPHAEAGQGMQPTACSRGTVAAAAAAAAAAAESQQHGVHGMQSSIVSTREAEALAAPESQPASTATQEPSVHLYWAPSIQLSSKRAAAAAAAAEEEEEQAVADLTPGVDGARAASRARASASPQTGKKHKQTFLGAPAPTPCPADVTGNSDAEAWGTPLSGKKRKQKFLAVAAPTPCPADVAGNSSTEAWGVPLSGEKRKQAFLAELEGRMKMQRGLAHASMQQQRQDMALSPTGVPSDVAPALRQQQQQEGQQEQGQHLQQVAAAGPGCLITAGEGSSGSLVTAEAGSSGSPAAAKARLVKTGLTKAAATAGVKFGKAKRKQSSAVGVGGEGGLRLTAAADTLPTPASGGLPAGIGSAGTGQRRAVQQGEGQQPGLTVQGAAAAAAAASVGCCELTRSVGRRAVQIGNKQQLGLTPQPAAAAAAAAPTAAAVVSAPAAPAPAPAAPAGAAVVAAPAAAAAAAEVTAAVLPDPRISLWCPPASPFSLLEEVLYVDPWKLLLACMLLNKTSAKQVRQVWAQVMSRWPTAEAMCTASPAELGEMIKPLGLYNKRALAAVRFSQEYLTKQWTDPRELYGMGKYAADAYFMFCRGQWQALKPDDKDLKKYHAFLVETGGEGAGLGLEREQGQVLLGMPPAVAATATTAAATATAATATTATASDGAGSAVSTGTSGNPPASTSSLGIQATIANKPDS